MKPALSHSTKNPCLYIFWLRAAFQKKKKNHKFRSIKNTNRHFAYFSFSFPLGQQKGVDRNIAHSWSYGHLCCPRPCHCHYRVSLRSSAGLPSAQGGPTAPPDPGFHGSHSQEESTCWVPTVWPVLGPASCADLISAQFADEVTEV